MLKKFFLAVFIFNSFNFAIAQHVPQLWALTSAGGNNDFGTISHFTPSTSTNTFDHSLTISAKGANPQMTKLTDGGNGKLYGMTYNGGSGFAGVIFEWDTLSNIYTTKVELTSATGNLPKGSLTLYAGKFYGMTSLGGINNKGVIFEWDPLTNIFIKKIDLSTTIGSSPAGSLSLYGGKFYGLTYSGGLNNKGVIFEWDPSTNVYSKKIDLSASIGANPYGSLELNGTLFYGMTYTGGSANSGTIFSWDPATNIYTKNIDLAAATGKNPYGDLTYLAGKFYGMTYSGGVNSRGVIFEWDPGLNIYTKKVDFSTIKGSYPQGSMTIKGSKLYGLTKSGGTSDKGVLFEWDPASNTYTKKIELTTTIGNNPLGSLINSNGIFYGLTNLGGGFYNSGVIFQWDETSNFYIKKIELNRTDGNQPNASFVFNSGKFYGSTSLGGNHNNGVIFEWDPNAHTYTNKFSFDSLTTGGKPHATMVYYSGKYYGTTSEGGINGAGVIFEWDPVTNIYTKKIDLIASEGSTPNGSLVVNGTKLYGMTSLGGVNNAGVIFEYDPSSNTYTKKIDLIITSGSNPFGSLLFNGTKFYGLTSNGGVNGLGVIFEWDPSSNIYTKRFDLTSALGSNPCGSLLFDSGLFYGLTQKGGLNDLGTIFTWNATTNVYTKKINFDGSNGSYPLGTMTLSSTGKYYGLTSIGSSFGFGVMFEWNAITNTILNKVEYEGTGGLNPGAYPQSTQLLEQLSNIDPVFSNTSGVENMCVNNTAVNNFTVTDADADVLGITFSSSNLSLLPLANITLTNLGSGNYDLIYTPVIGQTGTTVITVMANDGYGGIVSYVFTLNVNSVPSVTASASSMNICEGQSVTLNGGGASSYSWSAGVSDGVAFFPSVTTTYSVTGTITGCGTNSASVTITVDPIPSVTANASSTSICLGQSVTVNGGGANSYAWSGGVIDGLVFIPSATSTYTVTGTSLGCSSTATVVINVNAISIDTSVTIMGPSLMANNASGTYQWVDCNNLFAFISGQTNQMFSTGMDGNYAVIINESGCVDTSSCYPIIAMNIDNTADSNIDVYPNPSAGQISISIENRTDLTVEVNNTLGQLILMKRISESDNTFSLNEYPNGTYYLKIRSENEIIMKRIVLLK